MLRFEDLEKIMVDSLSSENAAFKRFPVYLQNTLLCGLENNKLTRMLIRHFAAAIQDHLIYDEQKSMDSSKG